MAENEGKSLADYAKRMGVEVDELKRAMKKYGLDDSDLKAPQKRAVLADAIENKWSQDQFQGVYDRAVPDSADFSWEQILDKYGYSLGVLKEFGKDLKPIFRWLAGQLQKGETIENLQPEFEKRLNATKFGNRTDTEIQADLARYGASKKDFRDNLKDLTKEIRRIAKIKYGDSIIDNLDEGVTRQVAMDLIYNKDGFLSGSFSPDDILEALRPYQKKNLNDEQSGSDDLTGEWGSNRAALLTWLSRNGVTLTDNRLNGYLTQLDNETMDLNTIKQDIRNTKFTRMYSAYADLFAQGQDIADVAMDYREVAARLLEKPMEQIGVDDLMVQQAMTNKGPDGKPAPMAMYEFEEKVRASPEWDKTNNAMKAYTNIGETILRNFGFRG